MEKEDTLIKKLVKNIANKENPKNEDYFSAGVLVGLFCGLGITTCFFIILFFM